MKRLSLLRCYYVIIIIIIELIKFLLFYLYANSRTRLPAPTPFRGVMVHAFSPSTAVMCHCKCRSLKFATRTVGTGSFRGVKRPERGVDHSLLTGT
jgi:hypothetical protein